MPKNYMKKIIMPEKCQKYQQKILAVNKIEEKK